MTAYWSDQSAREAHSKRMKGVYKYNPEVGKKVSEKLKELWLDPEYKEKAIASRLGKGTLSPEEITSRFKLIEESEIDIYSPGWVTRVSNLWGVSHTTVRRTFYKYWEGSPPYKRSW